MSVSSGPISATFSYDAEGNQTSSLIRRQREERMRKSRM
jgi:hypothetical protein